MPTITDRQTTYTTLAGAVAALLVYGADTFGVALPFYAALSTVVLVSAIVSHLTPLDLPTSVPGGIVPEDPRDVRDRDVLAGALPTLTRDGNIQVDPNPDAADMGASMIEDFVLRTQHRRILRAAAVVQLDGELGEGLWFTTSTIATIMGVDRSDARTLIKEHFVPEGPSAKARGQYYLRADAVAKLINSRHD